MWSFGGGGGGVGGVYVHGAGRGRGSWNSLFLHCPSQDAVSVFVGDTD